jgi:hypothetical protein
MTHLTNLHHFCPPHEELENPTSPWHKEFLSLFVPTNNGCAFYSSSNSWVRLGVGGNVGNSEEVLKVLFDVGFGNDGSSLGLVGAQGSAWLRQNGCGRLPEFRAGGLGTVRTELP